MLPTVLHPMAMVDEAAEMSKLNKFIDERKYN
jgi:hypothetical protein